MDSCISSRALERRAVTVAFVLCLTLPVAKSAAQVISAASGATRDLQAALDTAKTGDTVIIPAGVFNLNGTVNVPAGITLQGAGQDNTILAKAGDWEGFLLSVRGSEGLPVRITGMTLDGSAPDDAERQLGRHWNSGLNLGGNFEGFRVFQCTFKRFAGTAIAISGRSSPFAGGRSRGVVDHCTFIDIHAYGVVVIGDGDASWERPLTLGTEDAVFVEDCSFIEERWCAIASAYGSRYVFRHNKIANKAAVLTCGADAHGLAAYPRGSRSWEIYENTIDVDWAYVGIGMAGGDGVIFGNKMTGNYSGAPLRLTNGDQPPNGEGGDCAYPCKDQIRSAYLWNNTHNDLPAEIRVPYPHIIQLGRNYFTEPKPDYTPYSYPHPLTQEGAR